METEDIGILLVLFVVFTGSALVTYKIGRYLERKALTGALIGAVEGAYWDGYTEAKKQTLLYEGSK